MYIVKSYSYITLASSVKMYYLLDFIFFTLLRVYPFRFYQFVVLYKAIDLSGIALCGVLVNLWFTTTSFSIHYLCK